MPASPITRIPLEHPVELLVKLGQGSVTVTARDDVTEAVVRLTAREQGSDVLSRFTVEHAGRTLTVSGPRQGGLVDLLTGRGEAVDVEVTVPTGTPTTVQTAAAQVTLTGRLGATDLLSGSGDVSVGEVDGDLRARTGSGDVRFGRVGGETALQTGSGDVTVDEAVGALRAVFGSGSLRIGSSGGPVRSKAGSGDVRIDRVGGDVDLVTGSGEITLGLPAGVPVQVDALAGSGQVRSELPVANTPSSTDGAISVRTRTGSGDVRLFRAEGAPQQPARPA